MNVIKKRFYLFFDDNENEKCVLLSTAIGATKNTLTHDENCVTPEFSKGGMLRGGTGAVWEHGKMTDIAFTNQKNPPEPWRIVFDTHKHQLAILEEHGQ
ncbi:MAG: hypothetical protein IJU23_10310, partial [Proteobacteria bacterium]|nr:hypothetical protein [Pseudomonadota bacterium]